MREWRSVEAPNLVLLLVMGGASVVLGVLSLISCPPLGVVPLFLGAWVVTAGVRFKRTVPSFRSSDLVVCLIPGFFGATLGLAAVGLGVLYCGGCSSFYSLLLAIGLVVS